VIIDITEKHLVSDFISCGMYCFESKKLYVENYKKLELLNILERPLYVSHVINFIIGTKQKVFKYIMINNLESWSSANEYNHFRNKFKTSLIPLKLLLLSKIFSLSQLLIRYPNLRNKKFIILASKKVYSNNRKIIEPDLLKLITFKVNKKSEYIKINNTDEI
jgi:hypothetical protein